MRSLKAWTAKELGWSSGNVFLTITFIHFSSSNMWLTLPIFPNYKYISRKRKNDHSVSTYMYSLYINLVVFLQTVQLKLAKYSLKSISLYLCCWCIGGNCVPKATKKSNKMKTLILSSHIFKNTIIWSKTKIFAIHTENTTFESKILCRILKSTLTVGRKSVK